MKFKCLSCEKERPCTLIVKGDTVLPKFCPFNGTVAFCKWIDVKKAKEQSK